MPRPTASFSWIAGINLLAARKEPFPARLKADDILWGSAVGSSHEAIPLSALAASSGQELWGRRRLGAPALWRRPPSPWNDFGPPVGIGIPAIWLNCLPSSWPQCRRTLLTANPCATPNPVTAIRSTASVLPAPATPFLRAWPLPCPTLPSPTPPRREPAWGHGSPIVAEFGCWRISRLYIGLEIKGL